MLIFDQLNKGERPLRLMTWAVLLGLLVLVVGLWRVQILQGQAYRERQQVQSFRTVRVPAVRGRILDRDGRVLADTRPRYRLDFYLDELTPLFAAEHTRLRRDELQARGQLTEAKPGFLARVMARFRRGGPRTGITVDQNEFFRRQARYNVVSNLISDISARMNTNLMPREETLYRHWYRHRYLPFPLLDNLTPTQIAVLTEQGWNYPGIQLERVPTRIYPEGSTAAHIVGHVTRQDEPDPDEPEYDYRLSDYRGRKGLEFAFDRQLRGEPGVKSILVNSLNYRVGELMLAESRTGNAVVTTLDFALQRECERSLGQVSGEERGAVVVVDCRNGDVLALASAPTFDPNVFIPRLSVEEHHRLLDPVLRPMINRVTDEIYAPGSTFKVFTALALMENGVPLAEEFEVLPDPVHVGRGAYWLGNRKIEDLAAPGHYDFRRAFIKSSNSYFIDHGLRLGMKRFLDFGHLFKFGERTGLNVGRDEAGLFPHFGETLESNGQTWDARNRGVLADATIGQQISLTPLQLAIAYAAVANGGTLYWPRLVDRIEPGELLSDQAAENIRPGQVRSQLAFRRENLERLHAAMRDDVADPAGTGREARVPGFAVCGKTGTAEIKGAGRRDKVTWFASFGPYEAPRYAVIVMVESGRSGGGTCAPVARRIYEFLHERPGVGRPVAAVAIPEGRTP